MTNIQIISAFNCGLTFVGTISINKIGNLSFSLYIYSLLQKLVFFIHTYIISTLRRTYRSTNWWVRLRWISIIKAEIAKYHWKSLLMSKMSIWMSLDCYIQQQKNDKKARVRVAFLRRMHWTRECNITMFSFPLIKD